MEELTTTTTEDRGQNGQNPPPIPNNSIEGDGNSQIIGDVSAGGDIIINPSFPNDPFSNAVLNKDDCEGYYAPRFTTLALERTKSSHLLILYSNPSFSKPNFLRHLAWLLKNEFEGYALVKANLRTDANTNFNEVISKETQPTIYIVDDLLPLDFFGTPNKIARSAKKRGHIILASTEQSLDAWNLTSPERQDYWLNVPERDIYDANTLVACLSNELLQNQNEIIWSNEIDLKNGHFGKSRTLESIASELSTPDRILLFVFLLKRESRKITPQRIEDILNNIHDDQGSILKPWFVSSNDKDRMILIACTFFDGLSEYQFFQLVDSVIEKRWRHRVPELDALDFCDLDPVHHFYRFKESGNQELIMVGKFNFLAKNILRIAKKGYRRHIMALVPVISEAIQDSVGKGNLRPPKRLRHELAISLSYLGLSFPEIIDDLLFGYAKSGKSTIQRVAAKAVANWRACLEWERFESVIESWFESSKSESRASVRKTILMAIAYAAEYDRHNKLNEKIIGWLRDLYKDPTTGVQNSLKDSLPKLVRNHPTKLAPLLKDELLKEKDQIEPVAEGLALSMGAYPKETHEIIQSWLEESINSPTGTGHKLTHRDRVLLTAIRGLVLANPFARSKAFPEIIPLDLISSIRTRETQREVRERLFQASMEYMALEKAYPLEQLERLFIDCISHNEKLVVLNAYLDLLKSEGEYLPKGLSQLFSKLRMNRHHYQVRMFLATLCLEAMKSPDLAIFKSLYFNCEFVEERMDLLQDLGGRIGLLESHNDQWSIAPGLVLDMMAELRKEEFHPKIRQLQMQLTLQLLKMTQAVDLDILQKLFANSLFREKLEILKIYHEMIVLDKIKKPLKSLTILPQMIKGRSLQDRRAIFEIVAPLIQSMAFRLPSISNWLLKFLAQHIDYNGRLALATMAGKIYLDDQNRINRNLESKMYEFLNDSSFRVRQLAILSFLEFAKIQNEGQTRPVSYEQTDASPQPVVSNEADFSPPIPGNIPAGYSDLEALPKSPMQETTHIHGETIIQDPRYSFPLFMMILGWLIALFSPKETRKNFWLTLRTLMVSPRHGMASIFTMVRKWRSSDHQMANKTGKLLSYLFIWTRKKRK